MNTCLIIGDIFALNYTKLSIKKTFNLNFQKLIKNKLINKTQEINSQIHTYYNNLNINHKIINNSTFFKILNSTPKHIYHSSARFLNIKTKTFNKKINKEITENNTDNIHIKNKLNYMKKIIEKIMTNKLHCNWQNFEKIYTKKILDYNKKKHQLIYFLISTQLISSKNLNFNSVFLTTPKSKQKKRIPKELSTESFYKR